MSDISERRPYTFDRVIRIIFTSILVIGAIWLIDYLRGVLLPFCVACLIAYLIHPMVVVNKRVLHCKRNIIPVIITLLEVVLIIGIACMFFIPYIINEVEQMAILVQRYAENKTSVPFVPEEVQAYIVRYLNYDEITNMFSHEELMGFAENIISEAWIIMGSSIKVIIAICSWVVVLLYLVFILIDYDKVSNGFKSRIPKKYSKNVLSVLGDIEMSMNHYFRGQALISFIVGVLFSIGFYIIGLPLAVVFGLFIGILNMVPYLQLISIPMAAVLCLVNSVSLGMNFWVFFGETFAVYCVVQIIQDLILTPKIMGKYMGLNPAIIFLSLSIWGTLLGFIGLIIALPLTTLLISYYDRFILHIDPKLSSPAEKESGETNNKS